MVLLLSVLVGAMVDIALGFPCGSRWFKLDRKTLGRTRSHPKTADLLVTASSFFILMLRPFASFFTILRTRSTYVFLLVKQSPFIFFNFVAGSVKDCSAYYH